MTRGLYRGVYGALFDHPDYQLLSSNARLALLTARQCAQAGAAAIFRYYPEVLARQTGLSAPRLAAALRELAEHPHPEDSWIVFDDLVLWVRNGLRHDPFTRLADEKHRKSVLKALSALPHTRVVVSFCEYYKLPRPFQGSPKGYTEFSLRVRVPSPNTESESPGSNGTLPLPLNGAAPVSEQPDSAEAVLAWLNRKTGKRYRAVPANLDLIRARLKDGVLPWQLKAIVSRKVIDWGNPPEPGRKDMRAYLRPATLFSKLNCEQYLGELPPPTEEVAP